MNESKIKEVLAFIIAHYADPDAEPLLRAHIAGAFNQSLVHYALKDLRERGLVAPGSPIRLVETKPAPAPEASEPAHEEPRALAIVRNLKESTATMSTFFRDLPCKLTSQELENKRRERAQKLLDRHVHEKKIEDLKEKLKLELDEPKEQVKALKLSANNLDKEIESGEEVRSVECEWRYEALHKKQVRLDTREQVGDKVPLSPSERQVTMQVIPLHAAREPKETTGDKKGDE